MVDLQQLKDEYAKENGYDSWKDLTSTYKYSIFRYQNHVDEVAKRYGEQMYNEGLKNMINTL